MEDSFPVADFEVVRGHLSVEWKSIPPNGNVTHVVVLKPHKSGNFNFTSAQLSYLQSDGEDVQVCCFTKVYCTKSLILTHSPNFMIANFFPVSFFFANDVFIK